MHDEEEQIVYVLGQDFSDGMLNQTILSIHAWKDDDHWMPKAG